MLRPKTILTLTWLTLVLAVFPNGLLARPVLAAEAAWARIERIEAFAGRFGYEAYADRVVVIDNANGAREAVRVGKQSPAGETFRTAFNGDTALAGKLGPALSPEVTALGGKLHVQVFRNGAMLYEPASRTTWWGWHSQARTVNVAAVATPPTSPTPPAVLPSPGGVPSAIIDETRTLTEPDVQLLLGVLQEFKSRHGVILGVVLLQPAPLDEGRAKARVYRQRMVESGALAENSALFVVLNKDTYSWQCDVRVMEKISFEQVRYAWTLTGDTDRFSEQVRRFISHLSQLLGGKGPIGTPYAPPIDVAKGPAPVGVTPVGSPSNPVPAMATPSFTGNSVPDALIPGAIVSEKRIGPAGGSIVVPGLVTVEFPPGALKSEERVALRRARGTSPGVGFIFIERDGGDALLAKPARVRFSLPANLESGAAVAAQEIGEELWMICPSSYDSKTRTFEVEVSHFSGVGWFNKENCIKVVGGAATVIGTCVVWIVAAGTGAVAAIPASIGVGATAVIFAIGAVGAAAANPAYEYYQRMGLDGVITLGVEPNATDWVVRWKTGDYASDSMFVTVAIDNKGRLLTSAPGRYSKDELFAALSAQGFKSANLAAQIYGVQTIPRKIFVVVWALLQTKQYYRQNNYQPPGTVEVLVDNNLSKSKSNEAHLGEWDEKFLRIHSNLVVGLAPANGALFEGKRDELLATVAHEYWHVIYYAKGYKNTSKFSWLDEGMATALESEVGRGYKKSFEMYQAAIVAPQFERGVVAVSDPYCTWPLCKYLLHKKGGAYLTDVALGKFDAVAWGGESGLLAEFVRSLLITENALPDPLATSAGAIQTGWSKIEPSDWATGQATKPTKGYLALGANTGAGMPAMSYALRRVMKTAPDPTKKEAPMPLIVRRKTPDPHEVVIALKPQFAAGGQPRIGERRSAAEVRQGRGGIEVPKEWLGQPSSLVPIGLVNTTANEGSAEPLYVYLLRPPSRITAAPAGPNVTLRWQLPEFGTGFKVTDALRGYRVFYKTKDGKETMVPDLLIKPETIAVTVLASSMPGFVEVGLASEDGAMLDAKGEYLRSPIAWPEAAAGTVKVRVTEPKPGSLDGYGPMEVLAGKPLPNVAVTCDYIEKGKAVHREATTNARGECQFANLPLDVEIRIGAQNLSRVVICSVTKPQAAATFGWQGHEVDKTAPVDSGSVPRGDF